MRKRMKAVQALTIVMVPLTLLPAVGRAAAAQVEKKIEVHGHRGARARLPENTLPAFAYAVEQGVDFLEMDIAVTSDLKLVVSHDPHVNPVICRGPGGAAVPQDLLIHSLTLKEVKTYDCGSVQNPRFKDQQPIRGTAMPELREVFDLVKKSKQPAARTVRFNIETKSFPDHPEYTVQPAEFARLLVGEVKRAGMLKRTVFQSFDYRTLVEIRKLEPKALLSALSENPKEDLAGTIRAERFQISSPDWEMIDAAKVKAIQAAGAQVHPWTANTPEAWEKLVSWGVDGIITDDPHALIEFLKSKGLRK